MSKTMFNRLVKLGHDRPGLRSHISPILHHIRGQSKTSSQVGSTISNLQPDIIDDIADYFKDNHVLTIGRNNEERIRIPMNVNAMSNSVMLFRDFSDSRSLRGVADAGCELKPKSIDLLEDRHGLLKVDFTCQYGDNESSSEFSFTGKQLGRALKNAVENLLMDLKVQ